MDNFIGWRRGVSFRVGGLCLGLSPELLASYSSSEVGIEETPLELEREWLLFFDGSEATMKRRILNRLFVDVLFRRCVDLVDFRTYALSSLPPTPTPTTTAHIHTHTRASLSIANGAVCTARTDDNEEAALRRFTTFRKSTMPVVEVRCACC
jgi:hypothetical protein